MGEPAAFEGVLTHGVGVAQHRIIEQTAVRGFLFAAPHFRRQHAALGALPTAHRPGSVEAAEKIDEGNQREYSAEKYDVSHKMEWSAAL